MPLLSTFGAASARSFGGIGAAASMGPPEFQQNGMVYQASNEELLRMDGSSGINGNNDEVANTNFQLPSGTAGHSFPGQMLDVAWSIDDTSVIRIIGREVGGDDILTMPLDFTSSTNPVKTSNSDLQNVRALMMLRNGVLVTFCTGRNELKTWKMNPDGSLTNYASSVDNNAYNGIQCIINPDDGAAMGDDTHIIIAGHDGNRFDCVKIGGDGTITHRKAHTDQPSSGTQMVLSPMFNSNSDKISFMVFCYNQNTAVFDYTLSSNTFTRTQEQTGPSASSYGQPYCATPGWGGYTYAGYARNGGGPIIKFFQNASIQDSTFNSTYTGLRNNAILAIEDGTSSSGVNGHIYWGCYNNGSSPERMLVAADDTSSGGFSNLERSNENFTNGAYTSSGGLIGERPKYAEHDAKLASTHWN